MIEITVSQLLNSLTTLLSEKLDTARLDVEVLICHALNWRRADLYSKGDEILSPESQENISAYINRRLKGEPIAYIVGHQEFWSMPLQVNASTLIPRPETEHLVEEALKKIPLDANYHIADLGTGTGAIALAIAKERPNCYVVAIDVSSEALAVARQNAKSLEIANVELLQSHWFEQLADKQFDLIVSNPPYIAENDPHLTQGDVVFEPDIALSSGLNGLEAIEQIILQGRQHLKDQGWLMLEHGYQQANAVRELFQRENYRNISTISDLAGHERITIAQK